MKIKLPTEHHLEFLSLKGGCTGSSESTLVKMPHCWKSYDKAQLFKHVCSYFVFVKSESSCGTALQVHYMREVPHFINWIN